MHLAPPLKNVPIRDATTEKRPYPLTPPLKNVPIPDAPTEKRPYPLMPPLKNVPLTFFARYAVLCNGEA